jgi:predicted membrane protein
MGVKSLCSPNPLYKFLRVFRCEVFHSFHQLCWWFQVKCVSKLGRFQLLHFVHVRSCLFLSLWSWCCLWLLWFSVFLLIVVFWYVPLNHFGLVFLLIIVILMFLLISMILCSSCSSWSCVLWFSLFNLLYTIKHKIMTIKRNTLDHNNQEEHKDYNNQKGKCLWVGCVTIGMLQAWKHA